MPRSQGLFMPDNRNHFAAGLKLIEVRKSSKLSQATPVAGDSSQNWLNAKRDFGAMGDGVTDDSPALTDAIRAAGALRTPLVIPAGAYRINTQILIPSNVVIFGYGAVLLNYTSATSVDSFLGVPLVISSHESTATIERVSIFGLEIDGRRANQSIGKAGLRIQGDVRDVYIKECFFHDNTGDGWFTLREQGRDVAIPVNCVFEDVVCTNNARQGASITVGKHIIVRGGVYSNTSGEPPSAGIDIEPDAAVPLCEDIVLDGIQLIGNAGAGLLCDYVGPDTSPVKDVHVINCTIANNGLSGVTLRGGKGITIQNCSIIENGGAGIELDMYPDSPLKDLHMSDSRIRSNTLGGIFSAPFEETATGTTWKFSNLSVIDNGTGNPGQYHGIQIDGTIDDVLVVGCTVQNRDTENQAFGLVTSESVSKLRIDLNNFSGNVDGGTVLFDDESTRRYGSSNIE